MSGAKVVFIDGEKDFSNPKALRAWVRKVANMTVKDARKEGHTYYFDCEIPVPQSKPPKLFLKIEPEPCIDVGELCPVPPIYNGTMVDVLGKDLKPLDRIFNLQSPTPLTIDGRGIEEIRPQMPKSMPGRQQTYGFIGFHSVESGSYLSYKIELDKMYKVIRYYVE